MAEMLMDADELRSWELTTDRGLGVRFHSHPTTQRLNEGRWLHDPVLSYQLDRMLEDDAKPPTKGIIRQLRAAGYEGKIPNSYNTALDLLHKYRDLQQPPTELQLQLIERIGPLSADAYCGSREDTLARCPNRWAAGCFLKELLAELEGDWLCFL